MADSNVEERNAKFDHGDDFAEWMSRLSPACHDLPLNTLAIPGSHDCFSYHLNTKGELGPDCTAIVKDVVDLFGSAAKEIIVKWSVTQSLTLTQQLKMGIRFFDFRVAFQTSTNRLHFVHGLYGPKVEPCLQEIYSFLESYSKEIVILDFNHFYNMSPETHLQLLNMLTDIFGKKMCPYIDMESITLNMMWTENLQVVICYHHELALDQPVFWPGSAMQAFWANTDTLTKLLESLDYEYKKGRPNDCFYNWQGVLTPGASTILGHLVGSLRSVLTEKTNPAFVTWIKDKTPSATGLNIISVDFVQLFDFIPAVILLNEKLWK